MTSMTKWIGLGVLIVAFVFVAACERTVTTVEENTAPANCFGCHSDANTALVAAEGQWANSKHASGENIERNFVPCVSCHTSEGFVRRVNGQPPATIVNPTAIHCFTCHAPHTKGVSADSLLLRVTAVQKLKNGESYDLHAANICTACHQARYSVHTEVAKDTLSERWGPHHSVQADMLLGTNGYEYEGYEYEQMVFHKTLTDNGCLDCHFETTRNYILGGHSFNMAFDQEGTEVFNTAACAKCHEEELEDFNVDNVQTDVETLIAQLETLLINANMLVYYPEEGAWLPPERHVVSDDSVGAVWNYFMAKEDRSEGVHNSKYIKGLLESSIQFLQPELTSTAPSVAAGGDNKTAH